jgi:aminopeptidase N
MAHPVRPDSFVEINNFYTVTVYEKGAEVVRMYQTLLGREGFRKGMDLYFERHDGQAVQCDDFRAAMADANQRDLSQFERWYSQAGTPVVSAGGHHNGTTQTYELTLSQRCPATPGQENKQPFHIPVAVGLLGRDGKDMPLVLDGKQLGTTTVLELTEAQQTFRFTGITEAPVPSILRDFSAPVVLEYPYTDDELLHLFRYDSDPVNRWEAGQRLAMERLLSLTQAVQDGKPLALDDTYIGALRVVLCDTALDAAYREQCLILPSEAIIAEQVEVVHPQAIHSARQFMRHAIGSALRNELLLAHAENATPGPYSPDAVSAGKRGLKNLALAYLLVQPNAEAVRLASEQFAAATNMTDRAAALSALIHSGADAGKQLDAFYKDFKGEALVVDKWFAMQGSAPHTTVAKVRELMKHPAFTLKNPNRARSLLFSFCNQNPSQFHAADGSAYEFWAEHVIKLDALNPQVAARLARSMDRWRRYAPALQVHMRHALEKVAAATPLSNDVMEVVSKALAN